MGNFWTKCKKSNDNGGFLSNWGSSSKKYEKTPLVIKPPDNPIHTDSILALKAVEDCWDDEAESVHIYTGDVGGRVKSITESKEKILRSWKYHKKSITDIDYANGYIASASRDSTIKLCCVKSSQSVTSLKGHVFGVAACEFANEPSRLWSGSRDTTVRYWDTEIGKEIRM